MNKKSILLILVSIVQSLSALPYDFVVNSIYYNILSETDKTLTVTNGDLEWGPTDYMGNVIIPSTVDYKGETWKVAAIERTTFQDHQMMNSLVISEGIRTIPPYAFVNCNELHTISLPNSIDSIGDNAFYKCSRLDNINLPEQLKHVGTYLFEMCAIKHMKIPESMTAIPEGMFFYCEELESVEIPNSVKSIGAEAFHYCIKLHSISFPNQLESIGSCAFNESGLEVADIPNSVTFIDEGHI